MNTCISEELAEHEGHDNHWATGQKSKVIGMKAITMVGLAMVMCAMFLISFGTVADWFNYNSPHLHDYNIYVNNNYSYHPTLIGLILLSIGLVIFMGGALYNNKQPNLFRIIGIILGLVIFVSLAIFYLWAFGLVIGLTGLIIFLVLTGKLSGKLWPEVRVVSMKK
jgi:hypothetical protein